MAGYFDSNEAVIPLFVAGSVLSSSTSAVTAPWNIVAPYDLEIIGLSAGITTGAATAFCNILVNVQAGGTNLYSAPTNATTFSASATAYAKVDQSLVTFAFPPTTSLVISTSATLGLAANTTTTSGNTNTNVKVGQFVYDPTGAVPLGTRVGAYTSGTSIAFDTKLSTTTQLVGGTTLYFYESPTKPAAGTSVLIQNVQDSFFKAFNNTALTPWVLRSSSINTASLKYTIGPVAQNALYDTTTGFWNFTTSVAANATVAVLPFGTALTQGSIQLIPSANILASNVATTTATPVAIAGAPDLVAPGYKIAAGTPIRITGLTVNEYGNAVATQSVSTFTNFFCNLAVRKV